MWVYGGGDGRKKQYNSRNMLNKNSISIDSIGPDRFVQFEKHRPC